MRIQVEREELLKPLQRVVGAVERRQTMAILSHVLLEAESGGTFRFTATDLEVELASQGPGEVTQAGRTTVPARKLNDICRSLPEGATVTLEHDGDRVRVASGRSRFTLSALPAEEFPGGDTPVERVSLTVPEADLKRLLEGSAFAMAQHDVRYYLNGLLLELQDDRLRAVATDGHRLAVMGMAYEGYDGGPERIIVPRKGVTELNRLLGGDGEVRLAIGQQGIRAETATAVLTSKLVDGRFPEYERVLPQDNDKRAVVDRDTMLAALGRAAILSNDKFKGVRLSLKPGLMSIQASNPEQEQAEEEFEIGYNSEAIEVGFNVSYLMDALNALPAGNVQLDLKDAASSCLMTSPSVPEAHYVVMPMRL